MSPVKIRQLLYLLATFFVCSHFATSQIRAEPGEHPNILVLCVDDLRPELNCYGVDYIHSPNIDRLAKSGVLFSRHYVQSPSCGPSRFAMLTGRYESQPVKSNASLVIRANQIRAGKNVSDSMPAWFRKHGYRTVSVGKVSHHPGGLAGARWKDPAKTEMPNSWDRHLCPVGPWQDPEGVMHGLANGSIRLQEGRYTDRTESDITLFESVEGPAQTYPDGLIVDEGLKQLNELWEQKDQQPFMLYVGVIRPHLPFGAPKKYFDLYADRKLPPVPHFGKPVGKTTWHRSGEFMKYRRAGKDPREDSEFNDVVRKHYAACVSYADANVGRILDRLDQLDPEQETIVVLWGDHGFHLGEHLIWGKHCLFEESLRSPLIIRSPKMKNAGSQSDAITESVDVFPTLCDLAGLETPSDLSGDSLLNQAADPVAKGRPAISYRKNMTSIRTERYRMIVHGDGEFFELYDHDSQAGESKNIAESNPELVSKLREQMKTRLARKP